MAELFWFHAVKAAGDHDFDAPEPELLADLHDQIMKFGLDDPRVPIRRLAYTGGSDPLYASTVSAPGNINTVVSRIGSGGFYAQQCVSLLLSDPLPSAIIWDVRISHDDVREMIRAIDDEMRERNDAFDPVTGERLRCPRDTGEELKIRVDVYFETRGAIVEVPEGSDPEEYRQLFDQPEALKGFTSPEGINVLFRASDEPYIAKRANVFRQVLKEDYGIHDGDMSSLTPEQRQKVIVKGKALLKRFDN